MGEGLTEKKVAGKKLGIIGFFCYYLTLTNTISTL